jgi:hypothetical protein
MLERQTSLVHLESSVPSRNEQVSCMGMLRYSSLETCITVEARLPENMSGIDSSP